MYALTEDSLPLLANAVPPAVVAPDPIPASLAPTLPAPPTQTQLDAEAEAARKALRDSRIAAGSLPVAQQVAILAESTGLTTTKIREEGEAVATLARPIVYSARGNVPKDATRVTVYLECDNGYPFQYSAAPTDDLRTPLLRFMDDMAASLRRTGADGAAPSNADLQQAELIAAAAATIDQRLVIIGFNMRVNDYEASVEDISKRLQVLTAEVKPDQMNAPFLGLDGPLTPVVVTQLLEG